MKNKKGFTLVELLAVIVVLAIILVIAYPSVIKSINSSKEKTKYMAAKEIVSMAEAYMETLCNDCKDETGNLKDDACISVEDMVSAGYLENDVTNPATGENISNSSELSEHKVCKSSAPAQTGYAPSDSTYTFDGFKYTFE